MLEFKKTILVFAFIFLSLVLSVQEAFAGNGGEGDDVEGELAKLAGERYVITGQGFFTGTEVQGGAGCEALLAEKDKATRLAENEKKLKDYEGIAKKEVPNSPSESDDSLSVDGVSSIGNSVTHSVVSEDIAKGETDKGIIAINCNEVGFLKQMMTVFEPVNITQSTLVMKMIQPFQIIATGIAVILVAVYAMSMVFGEGTKLSLGLFLIRAFAVIFVINYIPYFIQDILNINNKFVWEINSSFAGVNHEIMGAFTYKIVSSVLNVFMIFGKLLITSPMALLLAVLLAVAYFVTLFIQIIIYWYFRLVMIIFYAVISPIFVVMAMLPGTANYASLWLKGLLGQVFSQTFLVISVFVTLGLSDVSLLADELGLTYLIAAAVMPFVTFKLMKTSISMAESIFGAGIGGLTAKEAQGAMGAIGDAMDKGRYLAAGKGAGKLSKGLMEGSKLNESQKADLAQSMSKTSDMMGALGMAGAGGGKYGAKQANDAFKQFDKEKDKQEKVDDIFQNAMEDGKAMTPDGEMVSDKYGDMLEDSKEQVKDSKKELVGLGANLLDMLSGEEGFEGAADLAIDENDTPEQIEGKIGQLDKLIADNEGNIREGDKEKINDAMEELKGGGQAVQAQEQRHGNQIKALAAQTQNQKNAAKAAVVSNDMISGKEKQKALAAIDQAFKPIESKINTAASQANSLVGGATKEGRSAGQIVGAATANVASSFRKDKDGAVRDSVYIAKAEAVGQKLNEVSEARNTSKQVLQEGFESMGMDKDEASFRADVVAEAFGDSSEGNSMLAETALNSYKESITNEENAVDLNDALETSMEKFNDSENTFQEKIGEAESAVEEFRDEFAGEVGIVAAQEATEALIAESDSNIKAPAISKEFNSDGESTSKLESDGNTSKKVDNSPKKDTEK